jgi:hypothetical protein
MRFHEILILLLFGIISCSNPKSNNPVNNPPDSTGKPLKEIDPDVIVVTRGTKISQLTGEYDRERKQPTQNKTYSRFGLQSTDLGVPFRYAGRTYLLFGDTNGDKRKDGDAIAYTTDTVLEDGLSLTFVHDAHGIYIPVTIHGISQGAFEVSTEGVAVSSKMYVYSTTDHSDSVTMGRSVVSRSDDSGSTFHYLYDLSTDHFINVSIVKMPFSKWKGLPKDTGEALVMVGSGTYRKSNVYLACQPASAIEQPNTIQYFAGVDENNKPVWSSEEQAAIPLFHQPCVGELSVSYNSFIDRWILLYNCSNKINIRTAKYPWGPWTKPQVLFDPRKDNGYCHFMHLSWKEQHCDSVMDPGRENVSGGVYGPYQFAHFATGDSTAVNPSTTIYFTMSTWNPYNVVLMKAKLERD